MRSLLTCTLKTCPHCTPPVYSLAEIVSTEEVIEVENFICFGSTPNAITGQKLLYDPETEEIGGPEAQRMLLSRAESRTSS